MRAEVLGKLPALGTCSLNLTWTALDRDGAAQVEQALAGIRCAPGIPGSGLL